MSMISPYQHSPTKPDPFLLAGSAVRNYSSGCMRPPGGCPSAIGLSGKAGCWNPWSIGLGHPLTKWKVRSWRWSIPTVSGRNNCFLNELAVSYSSVVNSEIYTWSSPEHPSTSHSSQYSEALRNSLGLLSVALLTSRLGYIWSSVLDASNVCRHFVCKARYGSEKMVQLEDAPRMKGFSWDKLCHLWLIGSLAISKWGTWRINFNSWWVDASKVSFVQSLTRVIYQLLHAVLPLLLCN